MDPDVSSCRWHFRASASAAKISDRVLLYTLLLLCKSPCAHSNLLFGSCLRLHMSNKTKATKKRTLEEANITTPKAKKSKLSDGTKSVKAKQDNGKERAKVTQPLQSASKLVAEDIDFPRGGGTSFTPLEVKAIRAEGLKEAEDELFKVRIV
jgi:hypothetical protein